jgi:ribonuclease D
MEEPNYWLITTQEELMTASERLSRESVIGFDTETTSLDPYRRSKNLRTKPGR